MLILIEKKAYKCPKCFVTFDGMYFSTWTCEADILCLLHSKHDTLSLKLPKRQAIYRLCVGSFLRFLHLILQLNINPNLVVPELSYDNNAAVCEMTYNGFSAKLSGCVLTRG